MAFPSFLFVFPAVKRKKVVKNMRKTLVFLFVALLLLVGCATKENEKEESVEALPSSTVAESEFGYYRPMKDGMVPPEGMIPP